MKDDPELREREASVYRAGYQAGLCGVPVSEAPAYTAATVDARAAWLSGFYAAIGCDSPEIEAAFSPLRQP